MAKRSYPRPSNRLAVAEIDYSNDAAGSDAVIVNTIANQFYKVTDANFAASNLVESFLVAVDVANLEFTVLKTGSYTIKMAAGISHTVQNTKVNFGIGINASTFADVEIQGQIPRKVSVAGDTGATSIVPCIDLEANDVVSIWVKSDKSGSVTIQHMTLNIQGLDI